MSEVLGFPLLRYVKYRLLCTFKDIGDRILLTVCLVGYISADAYQLSENAFFLDYFSIILYIQRTRNNIA